MESLKTLQEERDTIVHKLSVEEILNDYRMAWESRHASLIGRKEVFMGKAKFGVFGDGKEVVQIAMAKAFRKGDFRSGYYRDQTFIFALGEVSLQQFFAQLYAHASLEAEPSSAGRSMNSHFGSQTIDPRTGEFVNQKQLYNSGADLSPTAGQIPRAVGFAYASKLFRNNPDLREYKQFSDHGNEVAFATIGDAATSEGMFLEAINAAGVLQLPIIFSIWDDDFGISVPKRYHTTKLSISKALAGFQRNEGEPGLEIFTVKGWDYEKLCETYRVAAELSRVEHVPVLMHVEELTQPQGHSTSGSHERYKSKKRLAWEREYDCNKKMREWILSSGFASAEQLDQIEQEALETAKQAKNRAWKAYRNEIDQELKSLSLLIGDLAANSGRHSEKIKSVNVNLKKTLNPIRADGVKAAKLALRYAVDEHSEQRNALLHWLQHSVAANAYRYNSHLYSESQRSALKVEEIEPVFVEESHLVDGREVLQACFDQALTNDPRIFAIGEDVGKIGDVNQGFAGLQAKHGEIRVTDTGIRESSIIGQGMGSAMRGLRPIAEIQYLDYIYYTLATLTDDLASMRYRTFGRQAAPLIIRTRGHRLEGIWHSGSPMGALLHSLRGIYLLVPRNMVQAAGFYNTLFQSDDTALMIECLNAYRLKEKIPENVGEFTIPLGKPDVLREGTDVTIVTYGAMCRIVLEAAEQLAEFGISCEVLDVQTLIPL